MAPSQPSPYLLSRRKSSSDKPAASSPTTTALISHVDPFHSLVKKISQVSGKGSGLTYKDVNRLYLQDLLSSYTSNSFDWSRYAYEDPSKTFTRNLVDEGSLFNVTIQVWNPSNPTPITSHTSFSIVKVLQGNLKVTRYVPPVLPTHRIVHSIWSTAPTTRSSISSRSTLLNADDSDDETTEKEGYKREDRALRKVGERIYTRDEVIYIYPCLPGREEMWRFENTHEGEVVVTLHLNTPHDPSAESYKIYDERTGRKRHAIQDGYHSKFGMKVSNTVPLETPPRTPEE